VTNDIARIIDSARPPKRALPSYHAVESKQPEHASIPEGKRPLFLRGTHWWEA